MSVLKYNVPITAPSIIFRAGNKTNSVTNFSFLDVTAEPTATSGRANVIKAEAYMNPASKAAAGGCYAIRGLAGVKTGKTYAPSGVVYLAGVQGKLDPAGAVGDGTGTQIYAAAVLAEINAGAGSFGSETQVYGLWVDNQFAGNPSGLSHLVNITNNGGNITNVFKVYGNNKITGAFMNLETLGSTVLVSLSGNASHQTKGLLCVIDGATYYIPLQNAIN